uniref:FLYWCH-type domain-containing protein n=1 Tax=Meloidogyne hapla TaxID=6305 RepID=A0A1I8B7R2_MELHA
MDVREKLVKLQKSRKRRMPINDSSELSEIQQPETNLEDVDENYEATLVKFEQGVTNLGNVALWHAGYRYTIHKNGWWRCTNRDCQAKVEKKGDQFIGTPGKREHNHPPAIQKKRVEEIRNKLKSGLMPVLTEVRSNIQDEVYFSLGSDQALQRVIRHSSYYFYSSAIWFGFFSTPNTKHESKRYCRGTSMGNATCKNSSIPHCFLERQRKSPEGACKNQ